MAEASEGWDGTVDEAGIARILAAAALPRLQGFTVTAVAGQRRVILAAGESHYAFIRYENDQGVPFDLPTPTEGRWHLLVQRRDWASNTVTSVMLPGTATVATVLPDAVPSSYPSGFADSPGIAADIPICWIWVRSTDTTTIVVPIPSPGAPIARRSGAASSENSGVMFRGVEVRILEFLIAEAIPAGALLQISATTELYIPANSTYGGLAIIRREKRDGTTPELARTRWHTHGRGTRAIYPIVNANLVVTDPIPPNSLFSLRTFLDPSSAGDVEIWFPSATWSIS